MFESPFPTVAKFIVPPEIFIPEGIPVTSVPPAELCNLPAIFTVPPDTTKAPSCEVSIEFPVLFPKFAVPEVTFNNPRLLIVKSPVVRVAPLT